MRASESPTGSSRDRYGAVDDDDHYVLQRESDGLMRTTTSDNDDDDSENGSDEENNNTDDEGMSIQELLYSSSSYYAIAKPVTLTMVLAALTVVFVNTDETVSSGAAVMSAYQVWNVSNNENNNSTAATLATSLANALVMVSVICALTFGIVILYRFKFMKCLITYMIFCSTSLLGILGGDLLQHAIAIYRIPIDKLSFYFFMFNFAVVGVISIFWGLGVPKTVTQGYLIATSVILAWHLAFFDDWTAWTLLFMLALYDLCAVLTPCGPLKALVTLMSQDDAPEMPGLLFEADLPPEASKRAPNTTSTTPRSTRSPQPQPQPSNTTSTPAVAEEPNVATDTAAAAANNKNDPVINEVKVPLAIAKVYQLPVASVPQQSMKIMFPNRFDDESSSNISASPLLHTEDAGGSSVAIPESPTPQQLRAMVVVRLPPHGGHLEAVQRGGKKVYLERDRHGKPKRILWVDRQGKVFAEMRSDDEDAGSYERNSIRLGLGDFIFYSVMVAKAAQYSFATFAACTLVVLAGLGGTLVLLSVYGHALPALPISIFLGVIFYLLTRLFVEPWIEAVLRTPYYV